MSKDLTNVGAVAGRVEHNLVSLTATERLEIIVVLNNLSVWASASIAELNKGSLTLASSVLLNMIISNAHALISITVPLKPEGWGTVRLSRAAFIENNNFGVGFWAFADFL